MPGTRVSYGVKSVEEILDGKTMTVEQRSRSTRRPRRQAVAPPWQRSRGRDRQRQPAAGRDLERVRSQVNEVGRKKRRRTPARRGPDPSPRATGGDQARQDGVESAIAPVTEMP